MTLREYEVLEDGMILFKNVPSGLYYTFYCKSNNYETYIWFLEVSSSLVVNNRMNMNINLTEKDARPMYPCSIRIVDSKNNFMENVKCDVGYECSIYRMWSDAGSTDREGNLGVNVCAAEDSTVWVKVYDPYGNEKDFECEVPVKVAKEGDYVDSSIIKVYKRGKYKVMYASEFYV